MENIALDSSFDTFMNKVDCDLHRNLSLIKVFASICPLLGLLGTITGMIETFQAFLWYRLKVQLSWLPVYQKALITTVGGLVAAIPLLIIHNIVFEYATLQAYKKLKDTMT